VAADHRWHVVGPWHHGEPVTKPEYRFTESSENQPTPCPYCGGLLDAFTGITGTCQAKPGDASICAYCAGLLAFGDDLVPREPTDEELVIFLDNVALLTAQRAMQVVIRRNRGKYGRGRNRP
jgi:hypothetical protein